MGYDDGAGDFTFAASLDKAVEIGMMTRASADCILQKQYALYRRDLVDLSVSALTTPLADGSATLAESLAKKGVFTWEEGRAQGLIGGGQESYVHSSLRNTGAPKPEQSASSGADVIVNANFFAAYSGQDKFPVGHVMADGMFLYGVSGLTSFGFTESGEVYVGRPAVCFSMSGAAETPGPAMR